MANEFNDSNEVIYLKRGKKERVGHNRRKKNLPGKSWTNSTFCFFSIINESGNVKGLNMSNVSLIYDQR